MPCSGGSVVRWRRAGADERLLRTWADIQAMPGVAALGRAEDADRRPPILVPMKIRNGDSVFTWFSTLAVFGATGDITLEELVIEAFFPGDDQTRAFVEQVAARAQTPISPGRHRGPRRRSLSLDRGDEPGR